MWFSAVLHFTSISYSLMSILIFSTASHQNDENTVDNTGVGKYTEAEKNGLIQFRTMVEDVLERDYERSDEFLVRWIRACQLDLNEADVMLRKALQWRKDNKMESILNETLLNVGPDKDAEFCNMNGIAYDGTPVFIIKALKFNIRGWVMRGLKHNVTRKMNQCLERVATKIVYLNRTSGREVSQATTIVDSTGYNLKQHACFDCFSMYLDFLRDGQNFYPEYIKVLVLINAPPAIKPLLQIAKPMMVSSTLNAMHIFGSDKREWSSFLLKRIPSNQLSSQFGGTAPW